jgi:phospholipid transport system substrate-binding protein
MKRTIALAMLSALFALGSPALAEGPGERLTIATTRVLGVLQDRTLRQPGKLGDLRDQIWTIVNEIFDWREMSRQVLSPSWELLTAQQRDEFTTVFGDVLQRSYFSRMTDFRGEEIAIGPLAESIDGAHAMVRTKLMSKSHSLPIAYRFIKDETGWKVYDIAIEGVSILSSSHWQIGRLVQHFGYSGMMAMLKMKQNRLMIEENESATKISRRVDQDP